MQVDLYNGHKTMVVVVTFLECFDFLEPFLCIISIDMQCAMMLSVGSCI